MDAKDHEPDRDRGREALAALERTVPHAYRWARFGAPGLAERVSGLEDQAQARTIWRHPRLIFMGASGVGKTSLAVACLRRRVAESGKPAGFFHAYLLGVARIQHLAGRGEPEIVENAMKLPLALLDDVGSERDTAANALPDVIFVRHAEDRPLWVTTGLGRPQLIARYGAGIVRRLFERAAVIQVGDAPAE
jgi:DNA replication protein DnaC